MLKKIVLSLALLPAVVMAKDYPLVSPDGQNVLTVSCEKTVSFTLSNRNVNILNVKNLALELDAAKLGANPKVKSIKKTAFKGVINVDVPTKFKTINDVYNQLELIFEGGISITFRAYDNGVAYRFATSSKGEVIINNEQLSFEISQASNAIWPYESSVHKNPLYSHFEYSFKNIDYNKIDSTTVGLPLYFTASNGAKVVFTESDLFDYPNLFIKKNGIMNSVFPHPILEQQKTTDRGIKIIKEADYIAKTRGTRTYPWRLWMINNDDAGLLTNNLVFQLATPSKVKNTAYIKPGKVAWDWWNDNNIYGVDFRSGINTQTYKYYIDFAAKFGLPYIMLDEGWTKSTTDLLNPHDNIDIEELVRYGKQKHVDVLVWVLWGPLDEKMDEILDLYKSWGIKGIKVDFMQRAEQYMVNFYTRLAQACAKRELMVDFHGSYKPTGLNRTYPNVMSYEGVHGLENNKWQRSITPEHDALLPFTRMMAGPMDYTPGAMINATKKNFNPVYGQPMSMGTRAHQTALYVVFESPWMMLADNPSNYLKDIKYTAYLSQFPTVWDETKVLFADAGKAVVVARRNGDKWYIGGITNWDRFEKEISLDFLGNKSYYAEILADGINADRAAEDYKITTQVFTNASTYPIKMAPGGGFTIVLSPKK